MLGRRWSHWLMALGVVACARTAPPKAAATTVPPPPPSRTRPAPPVVVATKPAPVDEVPAARPLPTAEPDDVLFPPPFPADEIREATQEGRTYVWRVTTPDGVSLRKVVFRDVEEKGASVEALNSTESGQPLSDLSRAPVTWAELESHAHYPAPSTVVEEETITVPAGTYSTWRYTVTLETQEGVQVTRAWFALELPGAPVRHEVELDGVLSSKMELIVHEPGHPAES